MKISFIPCAHKHQKLVNNEWVCSECGTPSGEKVVVIGGKIYMVAK